MDHCSQLHHQHHNRIWHLHQQRMKDVQNHVMRSVWHNVHNINNFRQYANQLVNNNAKNFVDDNHEKWIWIHQSNRKIMTTLLLIMRKQFEHFIQLFEACLQFYKILIWMIENSDESKWINKSVLLNSLPLERVMSILSFHTPIRLPSPSFSYAISSWKGISLS